MTLKDETAGLNCHICHTQLRVGLARGRKSGKPSVMLACPVDGRHMRAFVADPGFVQRFVEQLEQRP